MDAHFSILCRMHGGSGMVDFVGVAVTDEQGTARDAAAVTPELAALAEVLVESLAALSLLADADRRVLAS